VSRHYVVSTLKRELKKCVCLCHNCHSKVHAKLIELPARVT
jgi:hypothetical protein